jgi:hypothetical protein
MSALDIVLISLSQLFTAASTEMITHASLQPTLVAEHRRGIDLMNVLRLLFG